MQYETKTHKIHTEGCLQQHKFRVSILCHFGANRCGHHYDWCMLNFDTVITNQWTDSQVTELTKDIKGVSL